MRFVVGVLTVALVTLFCWAGSVPNKTAEDKPSNSIPDDLSALVVEGDWSAVSDLILRRLSEHGGEPLPSMAAETRAGEVTTLQAVLPRGHKRILVLLAIDACPGTLEWLEKFRANEWRPENAEALVVLVHNFKRPLRRALKGFDAAYKVRWPLPGFLTYARFYPLGLVVDDSGRLLGYEATYGKFTAIEITE